jgi:glutaredoxin 3
VKAAGQVSVYWIPGCANCTRMKGYLTERGVDYTAVNVMQDHEAVEDMKQAGIFSFPVVRAGEHWVSGLDIAQVDDLLGLRRDPAGRALSLSDLVERTALLLEASARLARQLPPGHLDDPTPTGAQAEKPFLFMRDGTPIVPHATFRTLIHHIAGHGIRFKRIALMAGGGYRLPFAFAFSGEDGTWGDPVPSVPMYQVVELIELIASDVRMWLDENPRCDVTAKHDTYYGPQTVQQLLQTSTVSQAQHFRQLLSVVQGLGVEPDTDLIEDRHLEGLLLPATVWGD